jgi:hypothetical protein
MTNPIVSVSVSIQQAPPKPILQRTGAMISQGGTNTSQGTFTRLVTSSSLAPFLAAALTLSGLAWSSGVAAATTTVPHGIAIGDQFLTTIAGATPAAYNGTVLATATGASTFSYQLASDGGTSPATGSITYTPRNQAELSAMNTTFFANGNGPGAYALELGAGEVNAGVAFLTTWIAQNPNTFYSYLIPRAWDGNANFLAFLNGFEATNSKTYFVVTTTLQNWPLYAGLKCVVLEIEAPAYGIWPADALTALSQTGGAAQGTTTSAHGVSPGQWFQLAGSLPAGWNGWFKALPGTTGSTLNFAVPSSLGAETQLGTLIQSLYASAGVPLATEFSAASMWWRMLNPNPSPTNQVTTLNQAYISGVTPFPMQGNASLLAALATGNVNIVGLAASGGASNTMVQGGNNQDGNPWNYWYSVDWVQVSTQLALTVYIQNGANNQQAPVMYNQSGINGGQTVLAGTMKQGQGYGLVLNQVKIVQLSGADWTAALDANTYAGYTAIEADPFASYVVENPDDYPAGIYNGYAIDYTPLIGFQSITIAINVSFPT